ncbi:dihydropteroate synthase [Pedobacter changchengzhani]|uniref:dihydropteroate synthase n=1 Tax=Pedobacter changchengzhani TaxID=2529274 RepID=A0A4R5MPZ9_9SPHI|nr:dihydropteroate synthase [Pedobacter changchengzhani]TDG37912.1 dihydropteroate synthase [Pedobacter changchengzhani]
MAEINFFEAKHTLNIKGKLVDLSMPKVMAILNLTPDSFYSDSRTKSIDEALTKTEQFLKEGATFIDIGGYSTRPGADDVAVGEELKRILPIVENIALKFPEAIISVDTFRAEVAEQGIKAGAHLINDISAGTLDEAMFETVGNLQVPYIMMHIQGTPKTMQQNPVYDDVLVDVIDFLAQRLALLKTFNVHDVILDPGFGFGKTLEHNFTLLNRLADLKLFDLPLVVGFSRKGMVYKTLETTADNALNGTTVLNTIALTKGAKILRVHDVKEAMEVVKLVGSLVG